MFNLFLMFFIVFLNFWRFKQIQTYKIKIQIFVISFLSAPFPQSLETLLQEVEHTDSLLRSIDLELAVKVGGNFEVERFERSGFGLLQVANR